MQTSHNRHPHNATGPALHLHIPQTQTIGFMVGLGILLVSLSGCFGSTTQSPANPNLAEDRNVSSDASTPPSTETPPPADLAIQRPSTHLFQPIPDLGEPLTQAARSLQNSHRRVVTPIDPVDVVIYRPDARCETYAPEVIQVATQNALTDTVEYILANQTIPYFELSGYRLNQPQNSNVVTIDLRVSRTSNRVLNSLSACEQKALFGSLRETLVNHPNWDIDDVEFTNRGNRLTL
jgi:hypothetical protein